MPSKSELRRLRRLERCYRIAALLIRGDTIDRNIVARELQISPANADRHMHALRKSMSVTATTGRDGKTLLRLSPDQRARRPGTPTVVAACFGASLSRLFRNTPYEGKLKEVVAHTLETIKDQPRFVNHERQFLFVSQGGERALRQHGTAVLDVVVDAILESRILKVKYTSFDGGTKTRLISPLSLALYEHQFYVLGFESVPNGSRSLEVLRFSRISSARKLERKFAYPPLDEYDPEAVFRDSLGIFIRGNQFPVREVRFRLDKKWNAYVESHRWHESQQQEITPRGASVTLKVRTCPEVESLLLGFGEEGEVLEPADFRERIAGRIQRMAARYKRKAKTNRRSKRVRS